ncbi:MAG: VpsF family polysaccharide biosynthesis protein [Beijerinckiaceae bacterium]|nr:VpsF family polysaccharide biosynthesis protein [Beijerinckiaceae bacterium]
MTRPKIVGVNGIGAGAARSSPQPRSRPPFVIYVAAVAALFLLESGLLWVLGYNYAGFAGSPVTKIHPATYLVALAFFCLCFEHANPIGVGVAMAARRPACLLLIVAAALQLVSIASHNGAGAAGVFDTFISAPLAVMMFSKADQGTREKLEKLIHLVMIANAGLGIVELAIKHPIFPYRIDGEFSIYDMRATALQGHPLSNAVVTAVYTLALVSGGGTLAAWPRLGIILLQLTALVAFGGRVGLVVTVLAGGLYSIMGLFRVLRTGRVSLLAAAAAVLAVTLVPLVLGVLVNQGFFDAILLRFANDGGSAEARVKIMNIFGAIPLGDLLMGADQSLVEDLRRGNGLELGIENPIARLILYQGGIVTAVSVLAVGLFLRELARYSRPGMLLPMMGFLVIINTFESIGSKSLLLTKFAVMMLVLFRPKVLSSALAGQMAAGFVSAQAIGRGRGIAGYPTRPAHVPFHTLRRRPARVSPYFEA